MPSANPYLNFPGSCLEAFEFYRSVLGGEFGGLHKFSDMPSDGSPGAETVPDGVMHVSLPIGDSILMGSDVPASMGTVEFGSSCYVYLGRDTPDDGKRVFEELSEGGQVEMPYDLQFWGDYYGSFTDRYGVKWMVGVAGPDSGQPTG
jgi:PhnB protein